MARVVPCMQHKEGFEGNGRLELIVLIEIRLRNALWMRSVGQAADRVVVSKHVSQHPPTL